MLDTIWSSFRPWLFCEGICLLNTPQTGDTASFQRSSSLLEPLDNQATFVPCAARILWYSADKTSSRQLRDTIQNWQSEFLAVGSVVVLSIWLRERGSPESKPVHRAHAETGR
jgi:hypothetical protein